MGLNKTLTKLSRHLAVNRSVVAGSWQLKRFSSDSKGKRPPIVCNFNQPPLSESLPDLPKAVYSKAKLEENLTFVTKLHNGIRVATEDHFGQFCTVGVMIDCGSRYEVAYPSGVSHFLEKLAFNSTVNYESKDAILKELEKYGGICDCRSSRDAFMYAASALREGLDPVMKVIADAVLRPKITHEELTEAQETVRYELESLHSKPDQDLILMDLIHAAAYRDNTLGLPKLCPEKNLLIIDRETIFTFLKNYYDPSRIVVTGVGVNHDDLVNAVKKYFIDARPVWETDSSIKVNADRRYAPDRSVAQYTGGLIQQKCEIPAFVGPSGLPELAHVVIGLEGTSFTDDDFIPLCVLNMMMGGGGSFSAGGPGKGMFTRLYLNVLNKHHWIFSATAFNHSYIDTGLFCIHVSATPEHVGKMTEVIVKEMVNMAGSVHPEELWRAKKQLQSLLLMNLEAKPVVFEDIARQVLAHGFRKKPEAFINLISRVEEEDIQRVARRILSTPPAVAARGDISKLPSYGSIQGGLMGLQTAPTNKRLSLFH
ncbi:mitochondrial-processing peptidase subunit alpha [Planococcus citri]|uniref:mitochondrial-processing peptidase subunit alpha n=1 Tax=Planococcus citri TaxID=170843 RepID=UPI0031F7C54D